MKLRFHNSRNEKGFIAAFFTVFLPVFIGIFALTVDMPKLYSCSSDIKSGVDLATLAGISQLQSSSDITQAKLAAVSYLNSNLSRTVPGYTNANLGDSNLDVKVGVYDFSTSMFTWDEASSSVNAIMLTYSHQASSVWSNYYMINSFTVSSSSTAAKYYAGSASTGTSFPLAIEKSVLTSALSNSTQRIYQFGMSTNSYFTAFDNNASVGDIEDTIDYFQGRSGTPSRSVAIGDNFKYNSGALATAYLYINLVFPWTLPGHSFVFPIVTKGSGNDLTAEGFTSATINNFGIGAMGYYMDVTFQQHQNDNTWGGLQPGSEPSNIPTNEKIYLSTAYKIVE
jgi:hypothetical protein